MESDSRGERVIIYIHGFGGSGVGNKASLFREYFKERGVEYIAPSLSYIPDLAISTLEELIENLRKSLFDWFISWRVLYSISN